jgi:hypothetical protein
MMSKPDYKRIVESVVPVAERDALVEELRAALPEARVIKRVIDDHTSRVITFELLSEDSSR